MRFSVIIPVFEHWHWVPALLECLERQTMSADSFEVLLVDNGSKDFAPPPRMPGNARVLECSRPGSYAARNLGLEAASGQWLVFTDADCLPAPDWLECLERAARREGPETILAGDIRVAWQSETPSAYEIYDVLKGIPQARYVRRGYAATANLAVSRALAERLGGFDSRLFSGGDADFCRRAGREDVRVVFVPEAQVAHRARTSWREVATKARRIKGGQFRSNTAGRRLWMLRTLSPPLIAVFRFARAPNRSWRQRLIAILVQFRIWGLELTELVRFVFRGAAERR